MRLPVPYFKQLTDYTCAVACARMLLAFHGISTSRESLIHDIRPLADFGTSRKKLVSGLRRNGLRCSIRTGTTDDLRAALHQSGPVLVNCRQIGQAIGHYAVAVEIDDERIALNDPWYGEGFTLTIEEFRRLWYGYNSGGNSNKGWMVLTRRR